jgi:hypothetical protein
MDRGSCATIPVFRLEQDRPARVAPSEGEAVMILARNHLVAMLLLAVLGLAIGWSIAEHVRP